MARVFPFILGVKQLTLHVYWPWATFETFLQNFGTTCFDRLSLTFDQSSFAILHSKFLHSARFKQ